MNGEDGECALTIRLPVAVTENAHAGFYFDHAGLGGGESDAALQEKAGQGLAVAAAQSAARNKVTGYGLQCGHELILIE